MAESGLPPLLSQHLLSSQEVWRCGRLELQTQQPGGGLSVWAGKIGEGGASRVASHAGTLLLK